MAVSCGKCGKKLGSTSLNTTAGEKGFFCNKCIQIMRNGDSVALERQKDVAFDSAENMQRDVVLGFINDSKDKRVGMRVWNRSTGTVHTHKIPETDWNAWNLNINGGRIDPKCCNLSNFPVFTLAGGVEGNPLAVGAPLVAKNAGAWILGRYEDGRLQVLSLKGQTKDVSKQTATDFHNKHKIANAALGSTGLTAADGSDFPLFQSGDTSELDKFFFYPEAKEGQSSVKWIKRLGDDSYMTHILTCDNIRRVTELFSLEAEEVFFQYLAKIATKFSASRENQYGELFAETDAEFKTKKPDYAGCTENTRNALSSFGRKADNEEPNENIFYGDPGGKGVITWTRVGYPDLRFYPQDVLELAAQYKTPEGFFGALDRSSSGDAPIPNASGMIAEGVEKDALDAIVAFARKKEPGLAKMADKLNVAAKRTQNSEEKENAQVLKDAYNAIPAEMKDKMKTDETDLLEMKALNEELKGYCKAYYAEDNSPVSDYEYDMKFDRLRALEAKTGFILPDSVTQGVGWTEDEVLIKEAVSKLRGTGGKLPKITHPNRLMSLDKTKEVDGLIALLKVHPDAKTGVLSWKMDGLTIEALYEGGVLKQAATRGDGKVGEDVIHNARFFAGMPRRIPYSGEVRVRGEAIIGYATFEKINAALPEGQALYKNPRNLASGAVRRSDITKDGSIEFFAFHVSFTDPEQRNTRYAADLNWLRAQGFNPVHHVLCNPDTLPACVEDFKKKVETLGKPTDGLVLAIDNLKVQEELGNTGHHPKYAMAFKWEDAKEKTILRDIEWSASRTGVLTPVAIFDPVDLEGTTVKRASVHNLSMLRQLKLGIGDEVEIYKANMIIPQIAENLTKSDTCMPPTECPICGTLVNIRKDGIAEFVMCPNSDCTAKNIGTLVHFVKREAMNIDGISEKSIAELVEHGYIKQPVDFYSLSQYTEIAELPGWGKSSFSNMIYAIDNSRNVRLANFIYALGIKNVGRSASASLSAEFKSIGAFMDAAMNADNAAAKRLLGGAEGVGNLMQDDIIAYFKSDKNCVHTTALIEQCNIINPGVSMPGATAQALPAGIPQGSPNCLSGLSFCVTGKIDFPGKRDALIGYIESLGGRYNRSVTRGLNYLITNDTGTGTVKNKAAVSLGVKVISEPTFMSLVQQLSAKAAPVTSVSSVSSVDADSEIPIFMSDLPDADYKVTKEQWDGSDDGYLSAEDVAYASKAVQAAGWGFGEDSFKDLLDGHKKARAAGDYRTMMLIEYMLGDCNFRTESDLLHDGKYGEALSRYTHTGEESSESESVYTANQISGKTFCITGKVDFPGKRAALQNFISDLGGYNATSVTNRVDYLITNDAGSGSSKNKSAQALGVKVITEAEFMRLAGK